MNPLTWTRAWLLQKSAPLTVHYGRPLRYAGRDLPRPRIERVPTRHGAVKCWVYADPNSQPVPDPSADAAGAPTVVHFHGGAYLMRHPRMDDFFARYLVATTGVRVVLPDYDASPQVRYPVAQEQAHDVAAHYAAGSRIAVSGFSAGGNLAASACLQARDRGSFTAALQVLGVPSLDLTEAYADKQPVGRPMLGPAIVDLVRATYFADAARRAEPYASPACAGDLTGLPPALVITGEVDLLRREGDRYARALAAAGVTVEHRVVPGADHYFLDPRGGALVELEAIGRAVRSALVPDTRPTPA